MHVHSQPTIGEYDSNYWLCTIHLILTHAHLNVEENMIRNNYLGFLVLRPIGQCVGRNAISPKAKKSPIGDFKICLSKIQSTCLGVKLAVWAFPHSSQDSEYMTCAETTTWALMSHAVERLVPSQGLTIQQISMALRQQNFGCKMYSSQNPRFKEVFTCYVESGLPLAVAVEGGGIGHAIVCIGRKDVERRTV